MPIQSPQEMEMEQLRMEELRAKPGIQSARDDLAEMREEREREAHEARIQEMRQRAAR